MMSRPRSRDGPAMTFLSRTTVQTMRRRSRNGYRPSVDALDGRVLPSGGVAPTVSAAFAHRGEVIAAARAGHPHAHPFAAQQLLARHGGAHHRAVGSAH